MGVSGSLASEQLPAAVTSAQYNANNQLTQWGSTQMTYDLNGNTLNDGTNSYVWDARNWLVSANSGAAAFSYDPLGRRISNARCCRRQRASSMTDRMRFRNRTGRE